MSQAGGAGSSLARYMALSYAGLVVYASLHPLAGWAPPTAPLFAFLSAPWPRYYTLFDLVVNVLAYLPLGFLLVPALHPRIRPWPAALLALVCAGSLSLALETLQQLLPERVPSNLDLASNAGGGLVGAILGIRWGAMLTDGGWLHGLRMRLFVPGKAADVGLIVMAAWLLAQLNAENLLFGMGDLRTPLGLPPPLPYSVGRFFAVEFGVAAAGTAAAGLVTSTLVRESRLWLVAVPLVAALLMKAFASALVVDLGQFGYWITRGNMAGVAAGGVLVIVASRLSLLTQRAMAAAALLLVTALVNLAPENPYIVASMAVWQPRHFLNFNGLTRLVSSLWPFAALTYLMVGGRRR